MTAYTDFLLSKQKIKHDDGFTVDAADLNPMMFPFQRAICQWALAKGRSAIFADCGLGKGLIELDWARVVCERTGGDVLILAPLAVSHQLIREANKFGIAARYAADQLEVQPGITVTNYEKLHHFDPSLFAGVVLDESSCLKAYDSKTKQAIIDSFIDTPYKLAGTATPAPNDHMELGNHSEFLGVMTRTEMLATYFVHDGGETQAWRLKGHAEDIFWQWCATWGLMVRRPSDIGFDDAGYDLPALNVIYEIIAAPIEEAHDDGELFVTAARTLTDQRTAKRASLSDRVALCAERINASDDAWIVWCELNDESSALVAAIPDAVEVRGADSDQVKEDRIVGFVEGRHRVLVSKVSIVGFGLNFQHCAQQAFVGVTHSYEGLYQAVRRSWRFGQDRQVNVHIYAGERESAIIDNLARKQRDADRMAEAMIRHTPILNSAQPTERMSHNEERDTASGDGWTFHMGDCVEVVRAIPDDSIHFSIFSPPFASLYTYTNSDRDMGNCRDQEEFMAHFGFLADELYRVVMPGRNLAFHCMNLPTLKSRDGFIGLRDFRGELIKLFVDRGFIYHSEVCIWKDPVTQMQRTKALGLLHKQIKKDSAMSRQGLADYLVVMRKPGENIEAVTHTNESFPVDKWQRYASPVWEDINPSDTLQRESARDDKDERHIAPLQLGVIRRALELWTNPGDLVLSPFGGIASEGVASLEMHRQFIGAELKPSYWRQGVKNLVAAAERAGATTLFDVETPTTATD